MSGGRLTMNDMSPRAAQEHFRMTRTKTVLSIRSSKEWKNACKTDDDADRLIVTTAISLAEEGYHPGRGCRPRSPLSWFTGSFQSVFLQTWKRESFQQSTTSNHHLVEHIFTHAVTGCYTTSALFGQGKTKALKTLNKQPHIRDCLR
ncbi:hypothetical protein JTB14_015857 [Gonioctena quinquepunctata]|nr:hypothetical protein JTB14_015857 [Gonioctena quinquepunctata]